MKKIIILIAVILAAFLVWKFGFSKASTDTVAAGSNTAIVMSCPDMSPINVLYDSVEEKISFDLDGKTQELIREVTASGEKFVNADVEYWNKGQEVTLTKTATPDAPITCTLG